MARFEDRKVGVLPPSQAYLDSIPEELKDFRNFLFLTWQHLGLPSPDWVQFDIAHFLQHGPTRKIIKGFRGVGKSWIAGAYAAWKLMMNPDEKIMVVSASKDRADGFSIFVKRLIMEMEVLAHLKPSDEQRWSNVSFDVGPARNAQSPSVKSVGIKGQLTGSRASVIIADDIEVPSNSATVTEREKIAELVKEFDAVLVPGGEIAYLGTDQTEESLYATKLPQRGYVTRIWPARYPAAASMDKYQGTLAPVIYERLEKDPSLHGTPTVPERFSDADLRERELSYGRSGFSLQFMLDTDFSDAERYPLKLSDLVVMDLNKDLAPIAYSWGSSRDLLQENLPRSGFKTDAFYGPFFVSKEHWVPYQGVVMAIDPAGKGKDELGYAIVAMLNGNLFVLQAKGLTGGYADHNLKHLAQAASDYKVRHIIIEENFGGGMFAKLLAPYLQKLHNVSVEEVRSSKQKEGRIIDTLEPVMNQHRLVVDRTLIVRDNENYNSHPGEDAPRRRLFYQMTHITRDKGSLVHDDRLDALAMAVAYWSERMGQDASNTEEEHRKALKEKALNDFLSQFGQGVPRTKFYAVIGH